MQFGFMTGKEITDAIFIVRQLQKKYLGKEKDLWMAFVDLEKAFDRVPREVVWWALKSLGVDEWIVSVIKSMYGVRWCLVKNTSSQISFFRRNMHHYPHSSFPGKTGLNPGAVKSGCILYS